ncbi:hypothetical protein [Salidesulfovibrio onnuriiensis]|uniref:hypothetical protein n=1 Tax=Salidesulfovibrio onnuriiensis TaxID=2583823 RepID=UPI0011CA1214|nr:hypothetical protein [Salidesulfovibrio onnuriiensis]
MKFLRSIFMAIALVVLLCGMSAASDDFMAQGSAITTGILARFQTTDVVKYGIFVTNITDGEVNCKVTYYDHDGKNISAYSTVLTGNSGSSPITVGPGSSSFKLPAHATRYVYLSDSVNVFVYGSAIIEWNSTDKRLRKALIAKQHLYKKDGNRLGLSQTSINGDQPF